MKKYLIALFLFSCTQQDNTALRDGKGWYDTSLAGKVTVIDSVYGLQDSFLIIKYNGK